jgi:hypothetical protein
MNSGQAIAPQSKSVFDLRYAFICFF